MPLPSYQTLMLPLLHLAADQQPHRFREIVNQIANTLQLTTAERTELLGSGTQTVLMNRVSWARTYLKQAGALSTPERGCLQITERGLKLLANHPEGITLALLQQFPEFQAFKQRKRHKDPDREIQWDSDIIFDDTPEDILASAYRVLSESLEQELLEAVKQATPKFFEHLVVDLLVKMGYGGNRTDAGQALGKTGDGGIDGIINEDRLGLDVIYIQAKRWEGTVGRPDIQRFAGALQGQRAKKGVFITTSNFSREAKEYAALIETRIILIDGTRLAELMVEHNIGVSIVEAYEVKKLDSDYFEAG
jgi:restriction system protein